MRVDGSVGHAVRVGGSTVRVEGHAMRVEGLHRAITLSQPLMTRAIVPKDRPTSTTQRFAR